MKTYQIISENGERSLNQSWPSAQIDIMEALDQMDDGVTNAIFTTTASNKEEALAALERIREYIEKDL